MKYTKRIYAGSEKLSYYICFFLITLSLFNCCFSNQLDSISNPKLISCISEYRDGFYANAIQCIENILPDLTSHRDSMESYKTLAVSYGMINQIDKSKLYFRIILKRDSTIEIDTLAFPPNITLIYNQVKLEKTMSQMANSTKQSEVYERKRSAAIPFLLSSVVLSTGGAVYLCYNGYLAKKEYDKSKNKEIINKKWDEFKYSIAGGVGCTVVSGVATWLFFRVINKNSKVIVSGRENGVLLVYDF